MTSAEKPTCGWGSSSASICLPSSIRSGADGPTLVQLQAHAFGGVIPGRGVTYTGQVVQRMPHPIVVYEALYLVPKGKACTQAGFGELPAVGSSGGDGKVSRTRRPS